MNWRYIESPDLQNSAVVRAHATPAISSSREIATENDAVEAGREAATPSGAGHRLANISISSPHTSDTRHPTLQAKLAVSQPDDPHEREADQVADEVMRMPEPMPAAQPTDNDEKTMPGIRLQSSAAGITPMLYRQSNKAGAETDKAVSEFTSRLGDGAPLDIASRSYFDPRFGHDFSRVRIHADGQAAEGARRLNAQAYTHGRDIYFGSGFYQPHSDTGRRLLAHELTHAVQQSGAVEGSSKPQNLTEERKIALHEQVADQMAGTSSFGNGHLRSDARGLLGQRGTVATICRQKLSGSTAEEKQFVESAVKFLEAGSEAYQEDLLFKKIEFDETKFRSQLSSWKRSLDKSQGIIDAALGKDATLSHQLRAAYQNTVRAAVAFAANRLNQTSHAVYENYRDLIDEWALPQASADPTAGELSAALPEKERKKLTVITSAVIFDVDELFSTKIAKIAIPLPPGVTVRFASGVPARLQHGLKNVVGTIVPKPLALNSTMTLALDLEPYGGDYGAYRFTYVEHKPRKGKPTQDVLVEGLGVVGTEGATKSQAAAAQKKFDAHGFKRGSGWSNPQFESVLAAIAQIPESVLSPVDGITFSRERFYNKDPKAGGNYSPDTHTITIFDRAFQVSPTRFGMPGVSISTDTTRSVAHEIGHAVDLLPLRQAWFSLEQKQQTQKTAFAQYENPPGSNHYSFPNTEQAKFNKLKANIVAAESALTATLAESGERYIKAKSGKFEIVEGGTAAGSIEFRKAAQKDGGKRITAYSNKEWQEYYAESFSLYITDPGTLQRLRSNVYACFSKKHPSA